MFTFFMIALGLAAAFFVVTPFWSRQPWSFDPSDEKTKELERLAKEKQKIYNDIKDLDFEYGIGKMAESDYHALRKDAMTAAAKILQHIDAVQTRSNGTGYLTDEYLENLIRAKRKVADASAGVIVQTGDNILICPACSFHNHVTAKFCTECGTRLTKE